MLICRSAAKVNLTLDVLARRPDGYHELQSVVHTVGLWDTLTFEFKHATDLVLRCNDPHLETETNLCLQAARAWQAAAQQQGAAGFKGLHLTLEKQIPAGAGLGGGSGNAAATLLALNRHFDNPLAMPELAHIAGTLGADVPLFLRGGCALMEGIGERLTPLPDLQGWLVILKPPVGFSTPQIYRQWDALGRASSGATGAMLVALLTQDLGSVAKALQNDLSYAVQRLEGEAATSLDAPAPDALLAMDTAALTARLIAQGALGAVMTGSGSAVFGLFELEATARHAAQQLQPVTGTDGAGQMAIFVVPFCPAGVEFMPVAGATMP